MTVGGEVGFPVASDEEQLCQEIWLLGAFRDDVESVCLEKSLESWKSLWYMHSLWI